jgi:hypothetical protein
MSDPVPQQNVQEVAIEIPAGLDNLIMKIAAQYSEIEMNQKMKKDTENKLDQFISKMNAGDIPNEAMNSVNQLAIGKDKHFII